MAKRDRRDEGRPGTKEWEEFRASYAAARLHHWLLKDVEAIIPNYPRFLSNRLETGIDIAENVESDHSVPIPGASLNDIDYDNLVWWDKAEFELLQDQLFPHGVDDTDLHTMSRGLIAVAFHSALEAYFEECRGEKVHGRLPKEVVRYLAKGGAQLDPPSYETLIDLDGTRHLYVHNRGVVTEKYLANVPWCELIPGEQRVISDSDLDRFAELAWNTASKLHQVCE